MCPDRNVYLLDPQHLRPEVIAVAFAKTSRSPQSFREIAAELSDEKSAEFHDKWVVGYGHSSVAEHAVLHVAVENVSRLAVETLESNRLASYTEKSTRYQKWGPDDFFTPPELADHSLLAPYQNIVRRLFDTYHQALPRVREVIAAENPHKPGESEGSFERRIRSEYVDVARFILPAASLANVGMTINARALEHALRKMLSHPLAEVRQLGEEIKRVARSEVPTLVKYADAVDYLMRSPQNLAEVAQQVPTSDPKQDWCRLVHFDPHGELHAMAAALFRFGHRDYESALSYVEQMSPEERKSLAFTLLGSAGEHDAPLRELEHTTFTFEVTLDQGAYAELKRHRMMTQSPQPLTARLGYAIPRVISAAGFEAEFRQVMDAARQAYELIFTEFPAVASYVVPNAFNRRVLFTCNLRSADHFVSLRSEPNAHFSIRRIAQRVGEQIRAAAPYLGAHVRYNPDETWQRIEQRHFTQTA